MERGVTCVNFVRIKRVGAISTSTLCWELLAPHGCREALKMYRLRFLCVCERKMFSDQKKRTVLRIKLKKALGWFYGAPQLARGLL